MLGISKLERVIGLTAVAVIFFSCSALSFGPGEAQFSLVFPETQNSRGINDYSGVFGWQVSGNNGPNRFTEVFSLDTSIGKVQDLSTGKWTIVVQGLNNVELPVFQAKRTVELKAGDNTFTLSLEELLPQMVVLTEIEGFTVRDPGDVVEMGYLYSGEFQDTVVKIRNTGPDPLYVSPRLVNSGHSAMSIISPLPLGPILNNGEKQLVLRYRYQGGGSYDSILHLDNNDIEAPGFTLNLSGDAS